MKENTSLFRLLDSEISYRWTLLKILGYCGQPRSYLAVQEFVTGLLKEKAGIHTTDVLLKWLEETFGMERIQVEGQGMWQTTSAGAEALEQFSQDLLLHQLLSKQSEYRDVFLEILNFCKQPRNREEIEGVLAGNEILKREQILPAYFISELEKNGGLEWVEKRWHTTPDGKGVLA
jgi:hypothetical protein